MITHQVSPDHFSHKQVCSRILSRHFESRSSLAGIPHFISESIRFWNPRGWRPTSRHRHRSQSLNILYAPYICDKIDKVKTPAPGSHRKIDAIRSPKSLPAAFRFFQRVVDVLMLDSSSLSTPEVKPHISRRLRLSVPPHRETAS
jgi:hypothetical protein